MRKYVTSAGVFTKFFRIIKNIYTHLDYSRILIFLKFICLSNSFGEISAFKDVTFPDAQNHFSFLNSHQ